MTSCTNLEGPLCGVADCRSCWKKLHDLRPYFQEWRRRNGTKEPTHAVQFFVPPGKEMISVPLLGPGTELKGIFTELGITETENCGCRKLMNQMNKWGKDCILHTPSILRMLRENAVGAGWDKQMKTEWPEMWEQFDEVMRGLVEEAVRRAEAKILT